MRFDHIPVAKSLTALGLKAHLVPIPILYLNSDYSNVFRHFSPTIRNQIRKGRRRGVLANTTRDTKKLDKYYTIYRSIASAKGWQFIYPRRLTEELMKLSNVCRFIVAELDETVIGGGLFIRDGNSIFFLHGVADRTYDSFFPSRAILDSAIRWGCEIGAEFFNLGSCGQNLSLALFKSYWGSRIENNSLFQWDNPVWNRISKMKAATIRTVRTPSRGVGGILSSPPTSRQTEGRPNAIPLDPNSWAQRARLSELEAVLVVNGSQRRLLLMHSANLVAARKVLSLLPRRNIQKPIVLDFGCGNGRFLRYFGKAGAALVGLDVKLEMLRAARTHGLPPGVLLSQFDGVSLPFADQSFDMVWVCGVLKYTLFPPHTKCCRHGPITSSDDSFAPSYDQIAREMYRILKPGGIVAQNEMWVDQPTRRFICGFEKAGFVSERVAILRRYGGNAERLLDWRENLPLPRKIVMFAGQVCANLRFRFDDPYVQEDEMLLPNDNPYIEKNEYRDYLFFWRKHIH